MVTAEQKKEQICSVRLTKREYAYFLEMALKLRISLSNALRISLHDYIVKNAKNGENYAK